MSAPFEAPKPSFARAVRAVAWSFLGVRKNSEYQQDLSSLSPAHILLVALVGVVILVGALMGVVRWVVS